MSTNTAQQEVGFVVDAGPQIGYGHAVRCLRVAAGLGPQIRPVFYPLSQPAGRFFAERDAEVRCDTEFPPVMISDLGAPNPFTDAVNRRDCRHISIRDLGLAQCEADVVIDGSITTIDPYPTLPDQQMFVGPEYMVIEPRHCRRRPEDNIAFVTLGGGSSADYTPVLAEGLLDAGFQVIATRGFSPQAGPRSSSSKIQWVDDDSGIAEATTRCSLAITTSGVSLYEMLAAGVPTIALSVDQYQLKTAETFQDNAAVESVGIMNDTDPQEVVARATRVSREKSLTLRLIEQGRRLVDGKGLFRVTEIVRGELCPTN